MIERRPFDRLGGADHGWLDAKHHFSFAGYHDPARMGWGALRVWNDDTIAPQTGFPPHSHADMEIITYVREGAISHRDNLGNEGRTEAGDVQVMSAGAGIVHSEYNASPSEPLALFQIWIQTGKVGSAPRYDQKSFKALRAEDGVVPLVGPLGGTCPLGIRQDAFIARAIINAEHPCEYRLHKEGNGVYVFVIDGAAEVAGERLRARDALGISGTDTVDVAAEAHADVLIIEVPLELRGED